MSDRAQRVLLWMLALLLVGGTGLALRYAGGYRPLAGLGPAPSGDPAGRDQGIRFRKVSLSGREAGQVSWTLEAGQVEVARTQDRMVFGGGVTFDKMRVRRSPAASAAGPLKRTFTVKAGRVEVNGRQDHFVFSGAPVSARLWKPDGATTAATLTGPMASGSATYSQSGRTLRLSGAAVTGAFGDLRIEARQVDWAEDTNRVRCNGAVRATHPHGEMAADDLTVNLSTRSATLHNGEGRIKIDAALQEWEKQL